MAHDPSRKPTIDLPSAGRILAALDDDAPRVDAVETTARLPEIPGYRLEGVIGRGAGGTVYRARRTGLDLPLALKLLDLRIGEGPAAKRAWRELDLLQQLRLPCVPRLHDHGYHDGRLYLATDLIAGRPLLEHCDEHGLGRRERVELLARVADAVQALHERGIIHRDLKPGNVMVDGRGDPILIDLGIATLLDHGGPVRTITEEGAPIGSPAFMAPEQARGERGIISTRSDVYGLGATAYVVLTGETPHDMSVTLHEAIRRVAQDEPRDPCSLDATLPRPLAAILAKAVARDPERRYPSAAAIAADLRRWLRGEPVEAGGYSAAQRLGRMVGRHPVLATAAVCALIVSASIGATLLSIWWLRTRPFDVTVGGNDEKTWAHLTSVAGNVLQTWEIEYPRAIPVARLVDRPARFGGDRAVLIGFRGGSAAGATTGRLCLFESEAPFDPIWMNEDDDLDMPEPISTITGRVFSVNWAMVADVFPALPGDEIVALHRHVPQSAAAIRVYDMGGHVLYEVWHDGHLDDARWVPQTGQLVLWGVNSEATWTKRGVVVQAKDIYPYVVLAVRPRAGEINRAWIEAPGGGGTYRADWYTHLWPHVAGSGKRSRMTFYGPGGLEPQGAVVSVSVDVTTAGPERNAASIHFFLDERGAEVGRIVSSTFDQFPDELPDPALYRLTHEPLPPIVEE